MEGNCLECESSFGIEYEEEMTAKDIPSFCPFCGSPMEYDDVTDDYIEDDDSIDGDEHGMGV